MTFIFKFFEPRTFAVIFLVYIFCFALTAKIVAPLQQIFLSQETVFASLMFLPHGVRVLSVMLFKANSLMPLFAGHMMAGFFFADPELWKHGVFPYATTALVATLSTYLAFEIARGFGVNGYADGTRRIHWRQILTIGILAAILNSVAQAMVIGQIFEMMDGWLVYVIFAIGDIIGLLVSLLTLMMIFRWARLHSQANASSD